MPLTPDDITTDSDRWGYRTGARFVGPNEWDKHRLDYINRRHFYLQSLTDGLSLAADGEGLILDYRPNEFYEGTLSDAMRDEDDDPGWKLTYDRFSAMTLSVFMFELVTAGLLATRGNGDSVDYRLTLPGGAGA
ncbi:hypothetical protein [Micromonospora peucetia]|uniref:Uncharacterized protein n=1 Tax=Micromonospora peucetia TaxID=47871 RepID=A0A1C6TYS8_9ACTN|nr:hypothetical protein [Micromonospora peucetia]WSA33127.1 hypothetical protein OIE14_03350 [Micromonospora peucetia]SCL46808.1 hypothetical protein GA0070608_0117 [Micromonospora peucetia]